MEIDTAAEMVILGDPRVNQRLRVNLGRASTISRTAAQAPTSEALSGHHVSAGGHRLAGGAANHRVYNRGAGAQSCARERICRALGTHRALPSQLHTRDTARRLRRLHQRLPHAPMPIR